MRASSKLLIAAVLVAAGVGADIAWRRTAGVAEPRRATEPAIPVNAATVAARDVPIIVKALGTVQPIESVNVQARVNGQIMQVFFTQGETVKAGDPLFLIDPRPYQAALDQEKGQLAHDQAALAEARTDLARYQKLMAENSIATQQEADQAYVVQQDEGTVKLDQANVEAAALNLDYCHVNAPAAGVIGEILVDRGNYVQAGAGTTLATITQISPIYVSFTIPQTELDDVRAAQAKGALDAKAFSQAGKAIGDGRLSFINNEVAATTGTDTLLATYPNRDAALWPGEFVSVQLILGIRRNVPTAPLTSVMSGPNGEYVYTLSAADVAHRVAVKVAARQSGLVVFAKGVAPGDRVVTNGQYRLANDVKVAIKPAAKAAP